MDKLKFYAHHWGQKIVVSGYIDWEMLDLSTVSTQSVTNLAQSGDDFISYLELKPISEITADDAIALSKIHDSYHRHDFLRSKGYAVPFMGISVEELVERKWIQVVGTNVAENIKIKL